MKRIWILGMDYAIINLCLLTRNKVEEVRM